MKAQTPAEGILLRQNFGDAKVYQVACECGDSNHDHNVWVEVDEFGSDVSVIIYTTTKSKWWELNRWQTIWTLLTKGYVEQEVSIILRGQQALNYAKTLETAVKELKKTTSQPSSLPVPTDSSDAQ